MWLMELGELLGMDSVGMYKKKFESCKLVPLWISPFFFGIFPRQDQGIMTTFSPILILLPRNLPITLRHALQFILLLNRITVTAPLGRID